MVNITVDGIKISVPENTTILSAAKQGGIKIPTLCFLEDLNEIGACRICCVKVEGCDTLVSACNTAVTEGMTVYTNTPEVLAARKMNLQLILSEHDSNCTTCVRNGNCELRQLADSFNITLNPFESRVQGNDISDFPLIRTNSKCVKCMRCVSVCEKVQGLSVWDTLSSGSRTYIGVNPEYDIKTQCSLCGQCITHCPTGALSVRDDTEKVYEAIRDTNTVTVLQIAPAVRAAWGEDLGLDDSKATEKRMVAAAKKLGFDYVFDTDFAADLTIMEEANEFLDRLSNGGTLPMFTSCCPGWVRFMKSQYPEFADNLSTAKSPQQMFGAVAKTYFAEKTGIDKQNIFCVSLMPCTAKKFEAAEGTLNDAGTDYDVDAVLTTREFARMIKSSYADAANLPETEFDSPLGKSTGAGVIFGATGGVMEAALRSAVYFVTGKNPDADAFKFVRSEIGRREAEIDVAGKKISVAVVSGLKNTRDLIEDIKSGKKH